MNGILLLNKPVGISTNNLIQQVKKKLNIKKVGHAGTLDPLASGVVVVLINNGTKLSDFLLSEDKNYEFTIKLFTSTSTYDAEGEVTNKVKPFEITLDQLRTVTAKYQNYAYDQTPPIYSAIKVKGKKLYQYALDNQEIEIKPRTITINSLELLNYEVKDHELTFKASCSKGTYIRSLAIDIAKDLNTIGYVSNLVRTKSGVFNLNECESIDSVEIKNIISINETLKRIDYPIITIDNLEIITKVKQGMKMTFENIDNNVIFIADSNENILACYERVDGDLFKCKRGGFDN